MRVKTRTSPRTIDGIFVVTLAGRGAPWPPPGTAPEGEAGALGTAVTEERRDRSETEGMERVRAPLSPLSRLDNLQPLLLLWCVASPAGATSALRETATSACASTLCLLVSLLRAEASPLLRASTSALGPPVGRKGSR